jgi:hypothetical protein
MASFYENLSVEDVAHLDALARLLLELRESRRLLLARHGVDDEAALLERIRTRATTEHPAYEDYLGAVGITATREAIRAELRDYLLKIRLP